MISLDGVMQAPGGPKEDVSGGFRYGGWSSPYGDDAYHRIVKQELNQKSDFLLGRKTFDIWSAYWPLHADVWPQVNEGTKYVLSKRMSASSRKIASWKNSVVIRDAADIRKLKRTKGPDFQVCGSTGLIQLLLKNDLVDELRLKIHPLTLGKGKSIFGNGTMPAAFTLVDSQVTPGGVIMAHYRRAGKVKTGTAGL